MRLARSPALTAVEAVGAVSILVLVAVREAVTFTTVRRRTPTVVAPAADLLEPEGECDQRMRSYVEELRRHIEESHRSDNRVAWMTVAGGIILGTLGNVVVASS